MAAILFAIRFALHISIRSHSTALLTSVLILLLFGQAMISLPEQRFAITPMVMVWTLCLGTVIAWCIERYFLRTGSTG